MKIENRFNLPDSFKESMQELIPEFGYGQFSEFIFYRTYSRTKTNGSMENWADVVIRVTEGCFTIRKNHYLTNNLLWDEEFWQNYARFFAISMFKMEWLPAGRGLWSMGTEFVYERGAMSLMNCGYTDITEDIGSDAHWIMDALMCGVGVGFGPVRDDDIEVYLNNTHCEIPWVIPDSREGWCDSVKNLIDSFLTKGMQYPIFDYSKIRAKGLPIKGFGGIASGPEPLKLLHEQIRGFFKSFKTGESSYDSVRLKTDIANAIGCCVVAGNVRRSAEIACGYLDDPTFINLKNYKLFPERQSIGWMSNNSIYLETDGDFDRLGEVALRICDNGEPGIINLQNIKVGRVGRSDNLKEDKAIGFNPCGEQPLEDKELCNLVETFPTKCGDYRVWLKACEYATVYASTVTLLPTHRVDTNAVMMRNRRIGVSIADVTGWISSEGRNKVIKYLREGYKQVRRINSWVNGEAGIPDSVRVTTIKPGGTIPKLVGVTSGIGYPNFHYTLRRVRVAENSPIVQILKNANIPWEFDLYSQNTLVFSFPVLQGPSKPAQEASIWEQAYNLLMMQREWSDNAVSNTINFKPKWVKFKTVPLDQLTEIDPSIFNYSDNYQSKILKAEIDRNTNTVSLYNFNPNHEENDLLDVISAIAPQIKSASFLPQTSEGVYPQMPEQGITVEEFYKLKNSIRPIDWSVLRNCDGEGEAYCTSDRCELPSKK